MLLLVSALTIFKDFENLPVACLAESAVCAVRAVNGVQEVVQEAVVGVVGLVDRVISLEKDGVLWVDDWVADLEVEIGLWTCARHRGGRSTSVNAL